MRRDRTETIVIATPPAGRPPQGARTVSCQTCYGAGGQWGRRYVVEPPADPKGEGMLSQPRRVEGFEWFPCIACLGKGTHPWVPVKPAAGTIVQETRARR